MSNDNHRSVDSVLKSLNERIGAKIPIGPHEFVMAAEYLNVLISDEHDKLYDLEQKVAQEKLTALQSSKSVAEAKLKVEATDLYKEARKQKAKIDQVNEFIRIAKLRARLANDEIKNY